jgi:hypothetical protein
MNHAYQVPKRSVLADITLAGHTPVTLQVFLSSQSATHSGAERPSDLLNGPEAFLPASDSKNRVVFLHRDSIVSLTVDADAEFGGEAAGAEDLAPEYATQVRVEILLNNGHALTGELRYVMPEASRRLQDVLNQPLRFLTLRDGEHAQLVNKAHIVRVVPA